MSDIDQNVKSPCIRNCCLGDDDICLGCFRSLDEITGWQGADNQYRTIILHNAQQRREMHLLARRNYAKKLLSPK